MYNENIKIAVVGGDLRQLVMASRLADDGFEVALYGFDQNSSCCENAVRCYRLSDAVNEAAVIILPIPYSQDNCKINCPLTKNEIRIDELFSLLDGNVLVFAGLVNQNIESLAQEKGIQLIDYMKNEELNILNAIPTSEGAIEIALREYPKTLHGANILVTGFGRISKILSPSLKALGAHITLAVRSSEADAWGRAYGFDVIKTDDIMRKMYCFDIVFNTVPAQILSPSVLSDAKKELLIIDLASRPGGVDFEYAKAHGMNVIHALSLPGKCAPVTAGEIIKETVVDIMKKRGVI